MILSEKTAEDIDFGCTVKFLKAYNTYQARRSATNGDAFVA